MKTKAKAQKIHFNRRLIQRYGIEINKNEYAQLSEVARQNTNSTKITNRLKKTTIKIKGVKVDVVYDKFRRTLATALPKKGD